MNRLARADRSCPPGRNGGEVAANAAVAEERHGARGKAGVADRLSKRRKPRRQETGRERKTTGCTGESTPRASERTNCAMICVACAAK